MLDLCILAHLSGNCFVCLCTDGEDNRGARTWGLSDQPRPDQLCRHPATRQPERGGAAAVDVSGPQLDAPTVSKPYSIRQSEMKCIRSSVISCFTLLCTAYTTYMPQVSSLNVRFDINIQTPNGAMLAVIIVVVTVQ